MFGRNGFRGEKINTWIYRNSTNWGISLSKLQIVNAKTMERLLRKGFSSPVDKRNIKKNRSCYRWIQWNFKKIVGKNIHWGQKKGIGDFFITKSSQSPFFALTGWTQFHLYSGEFFLYFWEAEGIIFPVLLVKIII